MHGRKTPTRRGVRGSGPEPRGACPLPQTPVAEALQQSGAPGSAVTGRDCIMPPHEEVVLLTQNVLQEPFKSMCAVGDGTIWTGEKHGSIMVRSATDAKATECAYEYECSSSAFVASMEYIQSAEQVWAGFSDGVIRVFSVEAGCTLLHESKSHSGAVTSIHASASNVYTGGQDWKIMRWAAAAGAPPQQTLMLSGHTNSVRCIVSDAKRGLLFSGGDDSTLRSWSPSGHVVAVARKAHAGSVLCMCIPKATDRLWSGGEDGAVCIWNEVSCEMESRQSGAALHQAPVTQCFDIPDDGRVITTDKHGVMLLWDPVGATILQKLSPSEGGSWQRNAIQLARVVQKQTLTRVWTCSSDGAVRVWSTPCLSEADLVASLRRELAVMRDTREEDVAQLNRVHRDETQELVEQYEARLAEVEGHAVEVVSPVGSPAAPPASPGEVEVMRQMLSEREGRVHVLEAELDAARQVLEDERQVHLAAAGDVSESDIRCFLLQKKGEMDDCLAAERAQRAQAEAAVAELSAQVSSLEHQLQAQQAVVIRPASPPVIEIPRDVVYTPTPLPPTLPDVAHGQVTELQARVEATEAALLHSEEQRRALQDEVARAGAALAGTSHQLDLARSDAAQSLVVQERHAALLDEVAQLRQTLQLQQVNSEAAITQLRADNEALLAQQPAWQQEVHICKTQMSGFATERTDILRELSETASRLMQAEAALAQQGAELEANRLARDEVGLQKAHIAELVQERTDLQQQVGELSMLRASAETAQEQLRAQLGVQLDTQRTLESEVVALQARCEELRAERADSLRQASEFAAQVAALEQLTEQLRAQVDALLALQRVNEELTTRAVEAEARAAAAEAGAGQLLAEIEGMRALREQDVQVASETAAVRAECEQLRVKIGDMERECADLRKVHHDASNTSSTFAQLAQEAESHAGERYQATIVSLERDYSELKSVKSSLTNTIHELEAERDACRRSQAASEEEAATLRRLVRDLSSSNESLTSTIGELEASLEMHRDMANGSEHLKACVEELQRQNQQISSELNQTAESLRTVRTQAETTEEACKGAEAKLSAAEGAVSALTRENEGMKGPWEQLQSVLADSQATLASVQAQFRDDVLALEQQLREKDAAISTQKRSLLEKDSLIAVHKGQLAALLSRQAPQAG